MVTSRPGAGTKFEIYFPAADIRAAAETALPLTEPPLGRGERILYVDDEASLLALSKHILEGCGYRVTCFTDPVDGLRAFHATPDEFDAVLTDFAMPYVSGLELTESILRIRSAIPVILMSGHLRPEDERTAQRLGVREILRKPSSVSEMVYALGRLFNRHKDARPNPNRTRRLG